MAREPWREAAEFLRRDLEGAVGGRLRALLAYEAHGPFDLAPDDPVTPAGQEVRHEHLLHTLAVIDDFGPPDLVRLADLAPTWRSRRLAVPLLLSPTELARSLDAFPLEFAQILARHVLVAGADPFAGLAVKRADLRRACEAQTKSHLLHLREGYLEAGGDRRRVAELMAASAAPLRALLTNIARLHDEAAGSTGDLLRLIGDRAAVPTATFRTVLEARPGAPSLGLADVFPSHLDEVERLARWVDAWAV